MSEALDRLKQRVSVDFDPFWHKSRPDEVARALYSMATAIELSQTSTRLNNALYYTMVTNRQAPASFGSFMSRRSAPVASAWSRTQYMRPHTNVVGACMATFENRIGTDRPFVSMIPNGGDWQTRQDCQLMENVCDAVFDQVGLYNNVLPTAFRDAGTWGLGVIKVVPGDDGESISIERILLDEILIDEESAVLGFPSYLIQRRYVSRADLAAIYGDDDTELYAAILAAPKAYTSTSRIGNDMICVLEAWKLPDAAGNPGRHVYALPNYVLLDEDYEHPTFPFAWLPWEKTSLGFFPAGVPEILAPVQLEVNRHDSLIHEGQVRMSPARWLVPANSQISEKSLGNRVAAIVEYLGQPPTPITPQAVGSDIYESRKTWIAWGMQRVGLNEQTISGVKPPGLNSGAALRTQLQINDQRNKALQIMLEDAVKQIAELVVRAASEVNLEVRVGGLRGRTIKWDDLQKEAGKVHVYPISSLPSDPAGRLQEIEEQYANGLIDKRTYYRLRQMPDLQAYASMATAADDLIESTLDQICATKRYIAPEPYDDVMAALKTAQSRYFLEKRLGAPRPTLVAIQDYMFALEDLSSGRGRTLGAPPPPANVNAGPGGGVVGPPGAPGLQPPPSGPQGIAPAPAPLQISPPAAPPATIAA